jgi:hypothetical protein
MAVKSYLECKLNKHNEYTSNIWKLEQLKPSGKSPADYKCIQYLHNIKYHIYLKLL